MVIERGGSSRIMIWSVVTICVLPTILKSAGVDFGISGWPVDLDSLRRPLPHGLTNTLHHVLAGSFTHTILEWTAFMAALFTVVLAFVHFRVQRNVVIPILAVSLFWAGCMDGFHTLAADHLIEGVADASRLIPFTWAICRLFNALILLVGVGILLVRPDPIRRLGAVAVTGISLAFGVIAYATIHLCATSPDLPQTMFPGSLITRPWDVGPLALFVLAGIFVFWPFHQREQSVFSFALLLSVIPQIATQLHMAFGSTVLFDHHFNVAHFLKSVAYLVPFAGLCGDYVRTYRAEVRTATELKGEIIRRQKVVAELRNSETKFRLLFESARDAIIWASPETGMIVNCNRAAEELLEKTRTGIIGQHQSALHPSEKARHYGEVFKRHIADHGAVNDEAEVITASGTVVPVHVSAAVTMIGGEPIIQGIFHDISELKKAERERAAFTARLAHANTILRQKNEELDDFVYVASHDLQEPLRKITSFSDLLCKDLGPGLPDKVATDVHFIVDAAARMRMLIQNLLLLSRTSRQPLHKENIRLRECAEGAVDALSERIAETRAEIIIDELPEVWGDRTQLTQLYQNLIGNALKFTADDHPVVHLTGEPGDPVPILGVRDNGIGIDPQHFDEVFVPFKRLHGHTEYSGTGIGLAICRKATERHGGRIWVESKPGEGTHFRFTLNERTVTHGEDESCSMPPTDESSSLSQRMTQATRSSSGEPSATVR